MARARQVHANPAVRGMVREGVRAGRSRRDIIDGVTDRFPSVTPQRVGQLISEESRRQTMVDRMISGDKRRNVDLAAESGCPAGTDRLRVRLTLAWVDAETGRRRTYSTTVETAAQGRLGGIINDAINQATHDALMRGYNIPKMFSTATRGDVSYRLEYAECL